MNTLVSFELGQLLVNKNYPMEFISVGEIEKVPTNIPTIAEVVMWLYEKHGVWIEIGVGNLFYKDKFYILIKKYNVDRWDLTALDNKIHSPYNSPTEAYQESIKYTLTNLI